MYMIYIFSFKKFKNKLNLFRAFKILLKCREYNKDLYACFIDYSKVFDCVEHNSMWKIMIEMGFSRHLVRLIESLYENQEAAVRVEGETSEWFNVGKGVRQGCILSPYLFNVYAENIMRNVMSLKISMKLINKV